LAYLIWELGNYDSCECGECVFIPSFNSGFITGLSTIGGRTSGGELLAQGTAKGYEFHIVYFVWIHHHFRRSCCWNFSLAYRVGIWSCRFGRFSSPRQSKKFFLDNPRILCAVQHQLFAYSLKVSRLYRSTGASFSKAQAEFTSGVMRNEHVRGAAADVVGSAVRAQMSNPSGGTGPRF